MNMRMNKWLSIAMLAVVVLVSGCASQAATGEQQAALPKGPVASPAQTAEPAPARIVSTTVAITQFMDALNVDLVGIPTSVKELPKRYEGVTKIGNPMTPNMEIIKSLDPTEVYSVTTLEYDLAPVFKNANLSASFLDFTSLDHMNQAIVSIGEKYGKQKEAAALVDGYKAKVEQIKQQIAGKEQPKVLILLGVPGSYLVATENSYIGDLVRLAGGKNIVEGEKVEYLASNTEYLQKANPDVILRAAHGMPEEVVKMFDKEFKNNDIWKHFSAVQNNRVYDLPEELFPTTGNLAVGEALDATVKMLFP